MAAGVDVGMNVIVDPVLPDIDPYIFQFQRSGKTVRRVDGGFMLRLHSAWEEWGPVPPERLRRDTGPVAGPEAATATAWHCSRCGGEIQQNKSPNDLRQACSLCVMAPPVITWVEQYEKR